MVDGMKSGGAVKASRTYIEDSTRLAFEAGKATFMRNWSYAYALGKKAPKVKDRFEVSALPPFEGGDEGGVLGGNGPVVSAFTDNPEGAMLVARLLDVEGNDQARCRGVLAAADDGRTSTTTRPRRRDAPVRRGAALARRSRARRRGPSPPSTRRSRRPSSPTSTRRSAAR